MSEKQKNYAIAAVAALYLYISNNIIVDIFAPNLPNEFLPWFVLYGVSFCVTSFPLLRFMPDEKMAKYTSLAVAALPLLTSILSAGSFLLYSLSWFVAKMGGFFIALAIYRKLRHKKAKENDTKIIESLRNRPESAIFREKFTVIDVDYRDESYTTIESHTTIQHTHTSAGLISTPHTTYNSKHNEKKVQDLWLRDANGEERRIRLVNHDLS